MLELNKYPRVQIFSNSVLLKMNITVKELKNQNENLKID